MSYNSCDFLRMSWRNLDGAIGALIRGDVDKDTAAMLIPRLNRVQDTISAIISTIHETNDDNDMEQV